MDSQTTDGGWLILKKNTIMKKSLTFNIVPKMNLNDWQEVIDTDLKN